MGESSKYSKELVHLARLALTGTRQDVELYSRRVVRKLEKTDPGAAKELMEVLAKLPKRQFAARLVEQHTIPVDKDSRLGLLKVEQPSLEVAQPILESYISDELSTLVRERTRADELLAAGIEPSKAILFVGPPGVGKTMSARFVSQQLGLPLLTLDLSAVMSSYLGRTGSNIRSIFEFAKSTSAVLLLDELDAIAKKRDDEAELGELKRLVTVLLQDLDNWPSSNLLIAATNHEDLLDPAIWRRFDRVIRFNYPAKELVEKIVSDTLDPNLKDFKYVTELLTNLFEGLPHATIISETKRIKRLQILSEQTVDEVVMNYLEQHRDELSRDRLKGIARSLYKHGLASQRRISATTGISRDTIRKLDSENNAD